ncbi:MAG: homocysteine S-methyltransferase family protein [Desulfobacterales bacterium]|jgi:S-methylmethionine-dependent homocysteine/selenocysteine methylase
MDFSETFEKTDFILAEAAVIESLRRSGAAVLHPRLENALLIYDDVGRTALTRVYRDYVSIARPAGVPILICTPTWRANPERISAAGITRDVNSDAVAFLKQLKNEWMDQPSSLFIGGLVGCKNDCYKPREGLSTDAAEAFHLVQVHQLADAGVDFLLAATLPVVDEACGIARAMQTTGLPYIISFVINRRGRILDGQSLEQAFQKIDAVCNRPPLGYMINCAYPSFLRAHEQPRKVLARLIGFQANASSCDHAKLDGSELLQADALDDWGDRMILLNRRHGIKILGGCCGTGPAHLKYLIHRYRESS